jgi:guanylate kinase
MLVISSPSGAGKTSLSRKLIKAFSELSLSISCTTRKPRPGETDGVEYHFVSPKRFDEMVREEAFLEYARVHAHSYGTPRAPVMQALAEGRDVLFDVDWQGATSIAAGAPGDVVRVFILPPSVVELRARLKGRAQDTEEVIERRLAGAREEIAHWAEYDYVILNEDLDSAYDELAHVYQAERLRRSREIWLEGFVGGLLRGDT